MKPGRTRLQIQAQTKVLAGKVAQKLLETSTHLVLAESCTGGLIAALLIQTPGISQVFAGSFVVYQKESKTAWLGLKKSIFTRAPDGVSKEISEHLAKTALKKTKAANLSLGITGRLGPATDGEVWISIASRQRLPLKSNEPAKSKRLLLKGPKNRLSRSIRETHQWLAAEAALEILRQAIRYRIY